MKQERIVVVPGSFDPLTLGHRDVIERCAALFDRVIVGILINPDKKGMFTMEERKLLAQLSLEDIPNVTVETDSGYLTDFAERMGACMIVKGVRTTADFEYEQGKMPQIIGKEALDNFVPLSRSGEEITTQYNGGQMEHLGHLKMDFLGLCNLSDIKFAIQYVKEKKNRNTEDGSLC